MHELSSLVERLVDRDQSRSEATVQADVRSLLLTAPFNLDEDALEDVVLESPVGDRRRIDVETGTTVIEVKRDLRKRRVVPEALDQLAGYVASREGQVGCRYVGMLTDGVEWRCYHLQQGELVEVTTHRASGEGIEELLVWLEGVLATAQDIRPTPSTIQERLGAGSSSYALDRASLASLYATQKNNPSVQMKRELWARLLTTALGSQFEDSDDLFVEHTLLVNSADILAHAVLGLPFAELAPASLLTGEKFLERGIYGVVEPDFFDWVIESPEGEIFVRTLARRLARFAWSEVEHDVLKVLYESVISAETRKKLGEYYTPDWLAEKMVDETIEDPLNMRVLDPACGSGTFLFHAVREYLAAAEADQQSVAATIQGVTHHVLGMDLHPVAVTLARVTYVLALGSERLTHPEREEVQIPVYLGDSMQWQQKTLELWTGGQLVIQVDGSRNLFSNELRFPDSLLNDSRRFDQFVSALADRAASREPGSKVPSLDPLFQRFAIPEEAHATLKKTFELLCGLHDEGRDHIWGYYVRNLARPVWLALQENRVDVLIGNPPWLAYRHMHDDLQERFREMSESRGLWSGAKVATHQDLSGLFVARVCQLYLKQGGRFGFVMPNSALDRAQFAGFRTGSFPDPREEVRLAFQQPWDLRRLRPHFFPRGAAVIHGTRVPGLPTRMPLEVESWSGQVPERSASWQDLSENVERKQSKLGFAESKERSPYSDRFKNGATVYPRLLFLVVEMPAGPLGMPAGSVEVRSSRSPYEKTPWKEIPELQGVVESEFVRPLYLGSHLLPYRTIEPALAVLPWTSRGPVAESPNQLDLYPGLARWWKQAEAHWVEHRKSARLTLLEQLDYHSKLNSQFPVAPIRLVYAASGMHLCASIVSNPRSIIEHSAYWASVASREEALFLAALLNAAKTTQLVRPYMSYGKDERHIDKHIWRLPIPRFDPEDDLHRELALLAGRVETKVQELPLDEDGYFVSLRQEIRRFLKGDPDAQRIEDLVEELLASSS